MSFTACQGIKMTRAGARAALEWLATVRWSSATMTSQPWRQLVVRVKVMVRQVSRLEMSLRVRQSCESG